jgi:biopolymer transport protein ExbB
MFANIAPEVIVDGTLYVLLVFSLLTWSIILFKVWQYTKNNFYNRHFTGAFWDAPNLEYAKKLPTQVQRGPLARVAKRGFDWLTEAKQANRSTLRFRGTSEPELLEQALRIQTQQEQHHVDSGLIVLASIGSTAPFVGLFGTVLGIMNAMRDISKSGSASLDVVAGPIGDALIATAIGIAVAVPAVLAYNYLQRRSKQQRLQVENFVISFMHVVFDNNQAKT